MDGNAFYYSQNFKDSIQNNFSASKEKVYGMVAMHSIGLIRSCNYL